MTKQVIKKYSNGEVTVVWKPDMCIHSGNCWRELNAVFEPKRRPWITIDGAPSDRIVAQVGRCPSGALSSFRNDQAALASDAKATATVAVQPDGPLVISGNLRISHDDGAEESREGKTSFCRCGQSGNKPFCDGTHSQVGFKG